MLKVYNTLTKKKEFFKPRTPQQARGKNKLVELFVCGPTVYDSSHIGHARTYLAFDMIAKYLKEKDFDVFYLQNITDIDDKIIQRAKDLSAQAGKKITPQKLVRQYEKEYLKEMKELKVNSVTKYARATDHIKEIISQIKRLKSKGFTYQIKDGIYYNIKKFKNYGKLSKRTVKGAESAVSRIDEAKEKKNKGDFCLWKLSKEGEPAWDFKTGKYLGIAGPASAKASAGRPGWHIEDTAIAEKFFGVQYDVHGGAKDLIFPHHEAEIAQMEAISGKSPMVKYWLHSGFLTVKGKKMAKSLGNFITINDFLKKHFSRTLRFFIIKNHYRSPIDYNENSILQTERELARIDEFTSKLNLSRLNLSRPRFSLGKFKKEFEQAIEDDFNTPKAVAAIFELINKGNSLIDESKLTKKDAEEILKFFQEIDSFFNFIFWPKTKKNIPKKILNLVKEREKYRKQNNWLKADEIRRKITELGWQIEDTKTGPKLKKE